MSKKTKTKTKTKTHARVFVSPSPNTPLARAMDIPWVDAGIKPEVHGENPGYKQSKKLLLWVPNFGACTGLFITNNGSSKFLVNGFVGGTAEVTHWAYITTPGAPSRSRNRGRRAKLAEFPHGGNGPGRLDYR
jgi:hypothetical protein